jgi:hypothetical protein
MAADEPGGSILLGLLTMLFGGVVVGSTFLQWLSTPRILNISVNITGWSTMRTGMEAFGGSGFNLVLTGQGTVFFTGFFSLLLGALIVLCSIITLFRRRPGGVLALTFALAAAAAAAIDITMIYAKMDMSPGLGLWVFAGASLAALILGIIALSLSG